MVIPLLVNQDLTPMLIQVAKRLLAEACTFRGKDLFLLTKVPLYICRTIRNSAESLSHFTESWDPCV